MGRRYAIIAVTLPLLAIALGIVRAELFMRRAHDFVFEIAGFDPRDLLRGHYLQFRLHVDPALERESCEDDAGDLCCLCLTRVEGDVLVRAERATCATARASCEGALQTRYLSAAQRYYVPEHRAAELERRLRDAMQRGGAHAVVAVDGAGAARVRELRIDGEPIPGAIAR
jgi:uncharacterized membrane-anchored protein